jgi:diguanylate cyclase (GGDEF)-like protein
VFFLILWAGFFLYAFVFSASFFIIISLVNLASLFFLFFLHRQISCEMIDANLKKEEYNETINILRSEIVKENEIFSSLQKRKESYAHLKDLAEDLSQCSSVKEASDILSEKILDFFIDPDNTIIVYLLHTKTGHLAMSSARKAGVKMNIKAKEGDMFDRWVIQQSKPLLVEDIHRDYRFDAEKVQQVLDHREIQSLMVVPLMVGIKVIGLLRVDHPQEKEFTNEDFRLLSILADLGAVAIENVQLYERIQSFALKDSLTGLYLRRFLMDRLAEELPRHLRKQQELSLLMIDIDHFKNYNDQFGHIAGDMVLKVLGQMLLAQFDRPGEIVCRFGGEEFIVFLPDCSLKQAHKRAEEFRQLVAQEELVLRREKTRFTISVGVAGFPQDAQIKEELIHQADKALYQAKRKGRNRVCSCS